MNSRSVLLALALCMLPLASQAARPVQPPLTELTRSHIRVMAARALRHVDEQRIEFERIADLSGQSEPRTAVRADPDTLGDIEIGSTYVLAHSQVVSNPQRREEKLIDPLGPRIVQVRGLDSTALFEDNADLRFLFRSARASDPQTKEAAVIAALLRQLQRPDRRTRALVAMELYLRDELHGQLDAPQARVLVRIIDDPLLDDELRAFLVETAASVPGAAEHPWLFQSLREIIDGAELSFDLATHRPRLISVSVRALRLGARADDAGRIVPLLRANAPRVVEASIGFLEALDPALAARSVRQAIDETTWSDELPAHTRRILEAYAVRRQLADES